MYLIHCCSQSVIHLFFPRLIFFFFFRRGFGICDPSLYVFIISIDSAPCVTLCVGLRKRVGSSAVVFSISIIISIIGVISIIIVVM